MEPKSFKMEPNIFRKRMTIWSFGRRGGDLEGSVGESGFKGGSEAGKHFGSHRANWLPNGRRMAPKSSQMGVIGDENGVKI